MFKIESEKFVWKRFRGGYEIVKNSAGLRGGQRKLETTSGVTSSGPYICPIDCLRPDVGRRWINFETYEPLKVEGIYKVLADHAPSHIGAQKFVSDFGVPSVHGDQFEYPVAKFIDLVRTMRRSIKLIERSDKKSLAELFKYSPMVNAIPRGLRKIASLHPTLVWSEEEQKLELELIPGNLLEAIWWQFIKDSATGVRLKLCPWCHKYFGFGPGTKFRSDGKYCGIKCSKAHRYALSREINR